MATPLALVWDLIANDRASATFARVGDSAARSAEQTSVMGDKIAGMGVTLAAVGVALGVDAVHQAGNYQQALTKLATTAGESTNQLKMVGDGMLGMASQVGVSAQDLAKAMYTVESSGIHGADALVVLKSAAEGAKQEQADLGHVTDAVTTALHDYNLPATDAAKVTSQLVTAVSHGKTTFDELTGAMHSVTPVAAAAGISLADAAGTLASMTASGMSADQAAQNLGSAIKGLSAPTQPVIKEMAALGLNSVELSKNLGRDGVAGTLQEVSTAILQHMGPAGTTLLSTLNQSKLAGDDANKMYQAMAPQVRKVADELMNGTITTREFTTGTGHLDAAMQGQAKSWLTQYKNATGFSQALKSGGNDTQTYMEALKRATGTTDGMAVALQVTGEHANATNAAILDISRAAAQADGNIKGWDEVQGNFNQQLSEVVAGIKSWVIELGQHLLPLATQFIGSLKEAGTWLSQHVELLKSVGLAVGVVTAGLVTYVATMKTVEATKAVWAAMTSPIGLAVVAVAGLTFGISELYKNNKTFHDFVDSSVVPVLRDMAGMLKTVGAAVEGVGKFFNGLPGPVKAAVEALVAFRLAGVLIGSTFTTAMTSAAGSVRGLTASIGNSTLVNGMGVAYLTASERANTFARTQGVVAAASAGVKTGLSGLTSALGGPWGIAIAAATVALSAWVSKQNDAKAAQAAEKAATDGWTQAFKDSHGAINDDIKAKAGLDAQNKNLIESTKQFGIAGKDIVAGLLNQGTAAVDLKTKLQGIVDANTLSSFDRIKLNFEVLGTDERLSTNLNTTGLAAKHAMDAFNQLSTEEQNGKKGAELLADALGQKLNPSTDAMKDAQSRLNDAIQQGADKFTILNKGALDQSTANDSLAKAYNSLTDSVGQNGAVIDGNSAAALANRDAVKAAIQALSDKVQADYAVNSSTMTASDAQAAASKETEDGKQALIRIASQLGITGQAFNDLTGTIHAVPDQKTIDVRNNAEASRNAIDLLSSSIHDIPAQTKVAIDIAAGQQLNKDAGFTNGPNADGNIYSAFANGGVENHIAQIAPKSGRGRLWAEDETGGEAYIPLAPAKRRRSMDIWKQTGKLLGAYANGGIVVDSPSVIDIGVTADLSAAMEAVKSEVAARKAAASVGGVIPSGEHLALIDAALAADGIPQGQWGEWEAGMNTLIGRESGWNAGIVNNWDSNAAAGHPSGGLTQTIRSTFDLNRNPNLPYDMFDPVANIAASINYINSTYGGIGNVQQANANLPAKGYDQGGLLMPGYTMAYNGTGHPETVDPTGAGMVGGGASSADIAALGDRFESALAAQARTIQMMQRSMVGAR